MAERGPHCPGEGMMRPRSCPAHVCPRGKILPECPFEVAAHYVNIPRIAARTSILDGDLTAEIQRIRREEGRDYSRGEAKPEAPGATQRLGPKVAVCPGTQGDHLPNLYGICTSCGAVARG